MSQESAAAETDITIDVPSERVTPSERGGLVEDIDLMGPVARLMGAVAKLLGVSPDVCVLLCRPGGYGIDLRIGESGVGGLFGADALTALVTRLTESVKRLEENAKKTSPQTASEMGISSDDVRVIRALADVADYANGGMVQFGIDDVGPTKGLPVASPAALQALPPSPPRPRLVDGPVTGVGSAEGGTRVEVGKSVFVHVPALTEDEACGHFRQRNFVKGVASVKDGVLQLAEARFYAASQGTLNLE